MSNNILKRLPVNVRLPGPIFNLRNLSRKNECSNPIAQEVSSAMELFLVEGDEQLDRPNSETTMEFCTYM